MSSSSRVLRILFHRMTFSLRKMFQDLHIFFTQSPQDWRKLFFESLCSLGTIALVVLGLFWNFLFLNRFYNLPFMSMRLFDVMDLQWKNIHILNHVLHASWLNECLLLSSLLTFFSFLGIGLFNIYQIIRQKRWDEFIAMDPLFDFSKYRFKTILGWWYFFNIPAFLATLFFLIFIWLWSIFVCFIFLFILILGKVASRKIWRFFVYCYHWKATIEKKNQDFLQKHPTEAAKLDAEQLNKNLSQTILSKVKKRL